MNILTPYFSKFLTLAIIQVFAIFSPGPDFALVVRSSLIYSRTIAFFNVIGIILAVAVHILYNILGMGILIEKFPVVLQGIKIIGSLYLSYLGFQAVLSGYKNYQDRKINNKNDLFKQKNKAEKISSYSAFRNGLFTNIFNPKAIIFFVSIFTTVIEKTTPMPVMILYGVEIVITGFLCFSTIIYLFSIDKIRKVFSNSTHWVELITGLIFIVISIKIFIGDIVI